MQVVCIVVRHCGSQLIIIAHKPQIALLCSKVAFELADKETDNTFLWPVRHVSEHNDTSFGTAGMLKMHYYHFPRIYHYEPNKCHLKDEPIIFILSHRMHIIPLFRFDCKH